MRFLAHPWAVRLRSVARALGLTKLAAAVADGRAREARRARRRYRRERPAVARVALGPSEIVLAAANEEEYVQAVAFRRERPLVEALASRLGDGDCFWDVGANVGAYSCSLGKLLAERRGRGVAFEPDPWCHARLGENLSLNALTSVAAHRLALSDRDGDASFLPDPRGTTTGHLVAPGAAGEREVIEVRTTSGDRAVEQGLAEAPAVIKIDVEGYESEVLAGLRRTLCAPGCRLVLVEVHFSVLRARGLTDAPRRIESMLRAAGFSDLGWIDFSHLAARKPAATSG